MHRRVYVQIEVCVIYTDIMVISLLKKDAGLEYAFIRDVKHRRADYNIAEPCFIIHVVIDRALWITMAWPGYKRVH